MTNYQFIYSSQNKETNVEHFYDCYISLNDEINVDMVFDNILILRSYQKKDIYKNNYTNNKVKTNIINGSSGKGYYGNDIKIVSLGEKLLKERIYKYCFKDLKEPELMYSCMKDYINSLDFNIDNFHTHSGRTGIVSTSELNEEGKHLLFLKDLSYQEYCDQIEGFIAITEIIE